jgi:hypothetical protein
VVAVESAGGAVVPSSLRSKRMEAPVWAPAAFRKHGVYLSAETSTPHDGGRRVQP